MDEYSKTITSSSDSTTISPHWVHSSNVLCKYVDNISIIKKFLHIQAIDPRCVIENTAYLGIDSLPQIACVQACFCDIPFSNIGKHLDNYGKCGIAFDKALMLQKHRIQPIHYINPESHFAEDFRIAFNSSINLDDAANSNSDVNNLQNYLLSALMYMKPIVKVMPKPGSKPVYDDGKVEGYVYQDECEWRYVPASDTLPEDTFLILPPMQANEDFCRHYNTDILEKTESTWMKFEWEDIRYLIVSDEGQREDLIEAISGLLIEKKRKKLLVSKIEDSQSFGRDM